MSTFYSYGSCQDKNCIRCAVNRGGINEEIVGFIRLILGRTSKHVIVRSPVHDPNWQEIPEDEYWNEGGSWADWSRRVTASAKREKAETSSLEAIVPTASPMVSTEGISSRNAVAYLVISPSEGISSHKGRPKKYASRSEQMKAYRERKNAAA